MPSQSVDVQCHEKTKPLCRLNELLENKVPGNSFVLNFEVWV